jgi:hypothetical protein
MHVPTFVVIGGGAIGAQSVRQLLRARAAGRLTTDRIRVVDRDPECRAAAFGAPVRLEVAEWSTWLEAHLDGLGSDDHLVPYHWAPHLLESWLTAQLARAGARIVRREGPAPRGLPYEGPTSAGGRALSYASWICPPTCIEPALCPHTRGAKSWSLAADLMEPAAADALDGQVVFRCLHLVYGVGTIPVRDIQAARDRLRAALDDRPRRYLVATSSHCHALAGILEVASAPPVERA